MSVFLSPLHIYLLVNRQKSPQTYLSHNDSETRTNQVQSVMGLGFSMFGVSSRASSYSFNGQPSTYRMAIRFASSCQGVYGDWHYFTSVSDTAEQIFPFQFACSGLGVMYI